MKAQVSPNSAGRNPPAVGCAARRCERGASLLIALIALLMLTFMGLALVRSVDTSNLIAGNFAMRQAAVSGADVGAEAALAYVRDTVLGCANVNSSNQRYPSTCSVAAGDCTYYPSIRAEANGTVAASPPGVTRVEIDWSAIAPANPTAQYKTRYVIDRLCEVDDPGGEVGKLCRTHEVPPQDSSSADPLPVFACDRELSVFYRVTIRTDGPKETVSMVQTLIAAK